MAKKTKTKTDKRTFEEINAEYLSKSLQELREERIIPDPPSYVTYELGQRVQIGHIKSSIITEVVDNGKFFKLHQICVDNNYGNPVESERDMYVSWLDICPYHDIKELKAMKTFAEDNSIRLQYAQNEISSLFIKKYHFGIDMNPDYQRGNVWGINDKVNLINSIFKNIDIGKFVFVHLPYKQNCPSYEILDGKQRITAITEFYESRFPFMGTYFKDLSYRDQSHFEGHPIAVAELDEERIKPSDKFNYFLRLNTSGKPQDPKHIEYVEEMYQKALKEENNNGN